MINLTSTHMANENTFVGSLKRAIIRNPIVSLTSILCASGLTWKMLDGSEIHVGIDITPAHNVQPIVPAQPQALDLSDMVVIDTETGVAHRFPNGTYVVVPATAIPELERDEPEGSDPTALLDAIEEDAPVAEKPRKKAKRKIHQF